jgi:hypothetical protein
MFAAARRATHGLRRANAREEKASKKGELRRRETSEPARAPRGCRRGCEGGGNTFVRLRRGIATGHPKVRKVTLSCVRSARERAIRWTCARYQLSCTDKPLTSRGIERTDQPRECTWKNHWQFLLEPLGALDAKRGASCPLLRPEPTLGKDESHTPHASSSAHHDQSCAALVHEPG